jgi:hypothetical protein
MRRQCDLADDAGADLVDTAADRRAVAAPMLRPLLCVLVTVMMQRRTLGATEVRTAFRPGSVAVGWR